MELQDGAFAVPEGAVAVAVTGPNGEAFAMADGGASACTAGPCVTIETDVAPAQSARGVAATAAVDKHFATAEVVGRRLIVRLQGDQFSAPAPHGERLMFRFAAALFESETSTRLCDAGATGDVACVCGMGCTAAREVETEPVDVVQEEVPSIVRRGVIPDAAVGTGGNMARMALLIKAAQCPRSSSTDVDRTLNPFGLSVGADPKQEQVDGALVSYSVIFLAMCAIGGVLAAIAALSVERLRKEVTSLRAVTESSTINLSATTKYNRVYLLMRSGLVLWTLPWNYLYGPVFMMCTSAFMHSAATYQALAGVLAVLVGAGFPAVVYVVAVRLSEDHADVKAFPDDASWWSRIWWGWEEWVPRGGEAHTLWFRGTRLLYDPYRPRMRGFLMVELATSGAVGALTAWEPATVSGCPGKATALCVLMAAYGVAVAALRPYLAPYANVLDAAIALLQATLMGCVLVNMHEADPLEHWSASVGETISVATVYLIVAKFLCNTVIYVVDEREMWKTGTRAAPFWMHLFCCGLGRTDTAFRANVVLEDDVDTELRPLTLSSHRMPICSDDDAQLGSTYAAISSPRGDRSSSASIGNGSFSKRPTNIGAHSIEGFPTRARGFTSPYGRAPSSVPLTPRPALCGTPVIFNAVTPRTKFVPNDDGSVRSRANTGTPTPGSPGRSRISKRGTLSTANAPLRHSMGRSNDGNASTIILP